MWSCNGLIGLAFRRLYVEEGAFKKDADLRGVAEMPVNSAARWFTSPWVHMEAAMAYQLGLPL
ncbi:MAG: hypothetical protein AAGJ79_06095 [Verrucomicrobiota bacterium]